MSWRIELKPSAEKQYLKLDRVTRGRIKEALRELENTERPPLHPRALPLAGRLKGDYRVRAGGWHLLLTSGHETRTLHVYAILPHGGAY